MPFEAIGTGSDVTVEAFEKKANVQYLRQHFWSPFMSTSEESPIYMQMDLTKGAGDAITLNLASELQGGVTTGSTKAEGNEGYLDFYGQRITVDNDDISGRKDNVPLIQQRVHFSIFQALRNAIVRKRAARMQDRITNAMSDTSTGRVQGRYLYGSLNSNWNATHATALANVDNTDDQLTTNIGDFAKEKARIPTNNATMKIRPMMTKSGEMDSYEEWFGFVNHTYSIRDLTQNDARWRQPQLLIPPTSNKKSPIFTGSSFRGAYNGVLYYEWEGIELSTNTNSVQVGHSLFFGAQACAVVWAQFGKFTDDSWNYGKDRGLNHHEINGISKIVYDLNTVNSSLNNHDYGLVHVFVAAQAGT